MLNESINYKDLIIKFIQDPKKAAATRKFLVVEGLYFNVGDICPLPELIRIRQKYKLRIFIDESYSLGTVGKTGRGVLEHFNIPVSIY